MRHYIFRLCAKNTAFFSKNVSTLDFRYTKRLNESLTNNFINPMALRKAEIVYNFGLSECSRYKLTLVDSWSQISLPVANICEIIKRQCIIIGSCLWSHFSLACLKLYFLKHTHLSTKYNKQFLCRTRNQLC